MLIDKDEKNRVRGIHYLSARLPREELEEILGEYLERETYYYNVVTWLDRLLYSPPPLKHMFAKELEEKAK
jgi:hypothetical protein